jgi:hypothetical protein
MLNLAPSPPAAAAAADVPPLLLPASRAAAAAPLPLTDIILSPSSLSQLCLTASMALSTSTVSARATALFLSAPAADARAASAAAAPAAAEGVTAAVVTAGDSACGVEEEDPSGISSLGGLMMCEPVLAVPGLLVLRLPAALSTQVVVAALPACVGACSSFCTSAAAAELSALPLSAAAEAASPAAGLPASRDFGFEPSPDRTAATTALTASCVALRDLIFCPAAAVPAATGAPAASLLKPTFRAVTNFFLNLPTGTMRLTAPAMLLGPAVARTMFGRPPQRTARIMAPSGCASLFRLSSQSGPKARETYSETAALSRRLCALRRQPSIIAGVRLVVPLSSAASRM